MALNLVISPASYYPDFNTGRPIFNGDIFVGLPDTDPELTGNQKQITIRQEDGTEIPVSQPMKTSAGGVPIFNGSPVQILTDGNYSIKVLNKGLSQVYYVANAFIGVALTTIIGDGRYSAVFGSVADMIALTPIDSIAYIPSSGQSVYLVSYHASIPFALPQGGGGHFRVMTLAEYDLTPDERGAAFTVGGFAFVRVFDNRVSIKDFGAGGGIAFDTVGVQAAVDFAKNIYAPAGTYIITAQIDYIFNDVISDGLIIEGDGMGVTIFDNRVANGSCFNIEQQTSGKLSYGSRLKDFSIITTTSPIVSHGVSIRASSLFDINDLYIDGLSGSGIKVINNLGDADQNVQFTIKGNHILNCTLLGIHFDYSVSGVNAAANYEITENRIIGCGGCLDVVSAHGIIERNGFVLSNAGPQVLVTAQPGSENYSLSINDNFFEKGRFGELEIQSINQGEVLRNTFVSNDSSSGSFAILAGDHANGVERVKFRANRFGVHSSIASTYSCYELGANFNNNEIGGDFFQDISTATRVELKSGAKDNNNVISKDDDNRYNMTPAQKQTRTASGSPGTFSPNLLTQGSYIQYQFTSNGNYTIGAPVNGNNQGARITLGLQSITAGVVISFNAIWKVENFVQPLGGGLTHVDFIFDSQSAIWRQIGRWSIQ
jgi:hypothetical protein